ncbi:MAG: chemotaxis protein MotB, partial [Nitrospiraceae bacterium]
MVTRASEILKTVADKHIRVEGHTDDVPIGPKLCGKFLMNWELSMARATSVVRRLIEQGGLDRENLSAAG